MNWSAYFNTETGKSPAQTIKFKNSKITMETRPAVSWCCPSFFHAIIIMYGLIFEGEMTLAKKANKMLLPVPQVCETVNMHCPS